MENIDLINKIKLNILNETFFDKLYEQVIYFIYIF